MLQTLLSMSSSHYLSSNGRAICALCVLWASSSQQGRRSSARRHEVENELQIRKDMQCCCCSANIFQTEWYQLIITSNIHPRLVQSKSCSWWLSHQMARLSANGRRRVRCHFKVPKITNKCHKHLRLWNQYLHLDVFRSIWAKITEPLTAVAKTPVRAIMVVSRKLPCFEKFICNVQ